MAGDYIPYFLVVLFVKETEMINLHFNMPDEDNNFTMLSHLQFETVSKYCINKDKVCRSNNTNVCGLKMVKQKKFYKDFTNACFLFLSNMCDHPDAEYFIASSGSCEEYLAERRSNEVDTETSSPPDYETSNHTNSSETFGDSDNNTVTDADALRSGTLSTLDDDSCENSSFDCHPCPYSCPKTYSPVCVNVNRGFGKYFKMFTFINHCSADMYYCKHSQEFTPPPPTEPEETVEEMVRDSPLSWSFCGASRYLQFARFAEATSSMGHYGWLNGDYKYSHIMEPHQRKPGYG